jgi:hypothetical protein
MPLNASTAPSGVHSLQVSVLRRAIIQHLHTPSPTEAFFIPASLAAGGERGMQGTPLNPRAAAALEPGLC